MPERVRSTRVFTIAFTIHNTNFLKSIIARYKRYGPLLLFLVMLAGRFLQTVNATPQFLAPEKPGRVGVALGIFTVRLRVRHGISPFFSKAYRSTLPLFVIRTGQSLQTVNATPQLLTSEEQGRVGVALGIFTAGLRVRRSIPPCFLGSLQLDVAPFYSVRGSVFRHR